MMGRLVRGRCPDKPGSQNLWPDNPAFHSSFQGCWSTSHNGTDEFTFQIRFSEQFGLSYKTLRDHAFTVVGGTVKKAQRQVKGSNIGWTITVEPASNAEVEIVLPATTDCDATGAICTADGGKLSNSLDFTVVGPGE